MKIRTRIVAVLSTVVASLFIATPAFAEQAHVGTEQYSVAGNPVEIIPIAIVMIVLLAVSLGGAQLVGNLFEKKV